MSKTGSLTRELLSITSQGSFTDDLAAGRIHNSRLLLIDMASLYRNHASVTLFFSTFGPAMRILQRKLPMQLATLETGFTRRGLNLVSYHATNACFLMANLLL
jgi:hypothetical protein